MRDFLIMFSMLAAAHFIGDFLLQTKTDIKRKHRWSILIKHTFSIAVLTYLFLGVWQEWMTPVVVFLSHLLIDWMKSKMRPSGIVLFVIDQMAHLLVLTLLSGCLVSRFAISDVYWSSMPVLGPFYPQFMCLLWGVIATVRCGSFYVGESMQPLLLEMEKSKDEQQEDRYDLSRATLNRGLTHAGRMIGQLERFLVFLLVMTNNFSAIGFLIAAKSIFRFGELKDSSNRMESEYIIIGTLLSFSFAITVALAARFTMQAIKG